MAALKITGKGGGRRDRHFYVSHPSKERMRLELRNFALVPP
jgi:hypothetical protein